MINPARHCPNLRNYCHISRDVAAIKDNEIRKWDISCVNLTRLSPRVVTSKTLISRKS